jgi:hypothetical protein
VKTITADQASTMMQKYQQHFPNLQIKLPQMMQKCQQNFPKVLCHTAGSILQPNNKTECKTACIRKLLGSTSVLLVAPTIHPE